MRALLILLFTIIISGCSMGMSNDEIITEMKKCHEAGMEGRIMLNVFEHPMRVICIPIKGKEEK